MQPRHPKNKLVKQTIKKTFCEKRIHFVPTIRRAHRVPQQTFCARARKISHSSGEPTRSDDFILTANSKEKLVEC